jgi:hypothetical protein
MAQAGDGFGLFHGGMVFPQHEHGVRVVGKLRAQRQHAAFGIHRGRRGAGAVDANPDNSARWASVSSARTVLIAASIDSI